MYLTIIVTFAEEHAFEMKKLNQYILKRRVAKFLKETNRAKRYVDYKNASTILLIFESDYIEKNRFIRKRHVFQRSGVTEQKQQHNQMFRKNPHSRNRKSSIFQFFPVDS